MTKTTVLLSIGFVLLWNSGFVGAEYGLVYSGPFALLFWRYLALTCVILVYLIATRRIRWVGWRAAAPNMLVGILAHGVWLACVLLALNRGVPAGVVALVVALQPLATGAFSGLMANEPTPPFRWLGLVIGFVGVAVVVVSRMDFQSYHSVFGYLIPLGSVVAITAASLIQRRMEVAKAPTKLPVDLALFYQSLATTAALVLPAVLLEDLAAQWEAEFIYTMIWLILAVSLGAYALMWLLIERIDATRVASLFYLGPPVTMIMAWIAFGDGLILADVVGLLVVLIGVVFASLPVRRAAQA
ncbi:EamA family transporter [candidate division GN15 bacterium]|nr:EamA family transporter [candidate division GN15 bacterium]